MQWPIVVFILRIRIGTSGQQLLHALQVTRPRGQVQLSVTILFVKLTGLAIPPPGASGAWTRGMNPAAEDCCVAVNSDRDNGRKSLFGMALPGLTHSQMWCYRGRV